MVTEEQVVAVAVPGLLAVPPPFPGWSWRAAVMWRERVRILCITYSSLNSLVAPPCMGVNAPLQGARPSAIKARIVSISKKCTNVMELMGLG